MNFKRQPLNRNIAKNQIKSRVSFMRIILIWLFLPEMTLELQVEVVEYCYHL